MHTIVYNITIVYYSIPIIYYNINIAEKIFTVLQFTMPIDIAIHIQHQQRVIPCWMHTREDMHTM